MVELLAEKDANCLKATDAGAMMVCNMLFIYGKLGY